MNIRLIAYFTLRRKDSPINGTSTIVEPAMSDRLGEHESFLVFSSQDRRSISWSKPLMHEQISPLAQQYANRRRPVGVHPSEADHSGRPAHAQRERDPRRRRPLRPRPLRAPPAQASQLVRPEPRAKIHVAGSQWRRRAVAV